MFDRLIGLMLIGLMATTVVAAIVAIKPVIEYNRNLALDNPFTNVSYRR